MRFPIALLALLLAPALAQAQESAAVLAATDHVRSEAAASFAPAADLADLHAAHVAADRRTGATFVTLVQRHEGVEVWNATTTVAVAPSGRVIMADGAVRVETGLAARANASTPQIDAEAAVARAAAYVRPLRPDAAPSVLSDDPATDAALYNRPETVYAALGTPRLVYQPTADGALRLAWAVEIEAERGTHELWAVRVDAATGAVLAADDLVVRHAMAPTAADVRSFAPLAPPAPLAVAPASGAYSYRVVPIPFESPNHGPFSLVSSPDDPEASQLGWHATNTTTYDVTRGNNAWAYEDRDDNGSGATAPMTSAMTFDHAYDPSLPPAQSVNAAITSLFYWGNVFHDVFWHYGFDEASRNFQTFNFDRGGAGNDAVRLEAQDKADLDPCPVGVQCANNANFSTPSDGGAGRMQMYEWTAPPLFEILAPADIAGLYESRGAAFGTQSAVVTADAIPAIALDGNVSRGCTAAEIGNGSDAAGKVLFVQRGSCDFVVKARVAQQLGAAAVAVYNCALGSPDCSATSDDQLIAMGCAAGTSCADVTIPSIFVRGTTGDLIVNATATPQVRITLGGPSRDSDFDAGVIAHEYGHGLSNRLVGTTASCLGNAEQMGEGWGDYAGLMLTQQSGDTGAERRGVGTYLNFEGTDGTGIRNAPYSTDFAVNNYTYQSVISGGGTTLSVPHGIGFVWATMLWDMTWGLIDAHGYDPDVYNADGGAGNQIALNLVTTGLKLTACNPGFVSGRDGILAADLALYPDAANPGRGLHHDVIWAAFARRGLGVGASQGSVNSVNDGTASFTAPPVAAETRPDGSTVSLVVAGENPFRGATRLALTVATPQTVRVEMVDLLGRTVATVHDGPLGAETHTLSVSAAGLAPGVYLVRAIGEDFVLSERLTVTR